MVEGTRARGRKKIKNVGAVNKIVVNMAGLDLGREA